MDDSLRGWSKKDKYEEPEIKVVLSEENFPDPNFREALKKLFGKESLMANEIYDFRMVYLDLSNKGIKSIKGLELLEEVTELDLSYNEIEDISPININKLESLCALDLSYNKLGDNAYKDLSLLNYYITELKLSGNNITDISFINDWTPEQCTKFTLCLDDNPIKDASPLAKLEYTEILSINNTAIKDLSPVLPLAPYLIDLKARDNGIEDIFILSAYPICFQSLEYLDLRGNDIEDFSPLSSFNLGSIRCEIETNNGFLTAFGENSYMKEPLDYYSDNSTIKLDYYDFPDKNLRKALEDILEKEKEEVSKNIVYSEYKGTDYRPPYDLEDLMSRVYELDLSDANIKDIKGLEIFSNLTCLDLSNNQIEDISYLKGLPLGDLDLGRNKIKDASALGDIKELTDVNLSYNQIEDISFIKKWVENKNWILGLYLNNNKIKDATPVLELKDLCVLSLSDNQIEYLPPLTEDMFPDLESIAVGGNKFKNYDFLKDLPLGAYDIEIPVELTEVVTKKEPLAKKLANSKYEKNKENLQANKQEIKLDKKENKKGLGL